MSTLKEAVFNLYAARYTKKYLVAEAKWGASPLYAEMDFIVKHFESLGRTDLTENMESLINNTITQSQLYAKMSGAVLHNLILGFKDQAKALSETKPLPNLKEYHVGVSDV